MIFCGLNRERAQPPDSLFIGIIEVLQSERQEKGLKAALSCVALRLTKKKVLKGEFSF